MAENYTDPYALLGVPPTASLAEIKQAYFAHVRAHPPERDRAAFKRIRAAYERLNNAERRLETDMLLLNRWQMPVGKRRAMKLDLTLHREDVLAIARAYSDLERKDWREHYEKVKL